MFHTSNTKHGMFQGHTCARHCLLGGRLQDWRSCEAKKEATVWVSRSPSEEPASSYERSDALVPNSDALVTI